MKKRRFTEPGLNFLTHPCFSETFPSGIVFSVLFLYNAAPLRHAGREQFGNQQHLMLSGPIGLVRPPKTLTDPNATSEAKSLMSYLVDYYGQQVLSGQQDMSEMNYIYSVTGKWPAVGVLDLMDYSPSRIEHGTNPTGTVESYINWANSGGGILSSSWHWNAPTDLINDQNAPWWSGFYTYATTFDIQAALADPCGADYQLVLRDLDAIAVQLQKFQDANLPCSGGLFTRHPAVGSGGEQKDRGLLFSCGG